MPKVSICIPTYNRKNYLRETLASVFAQTYKDYEVIVLDDGSNDGTPEMMKSASYDVRYYWQENQGEACARNRLVALARGEYISFIDSDDLLIPDAIERLVKAIEAEPDDVIAYGSYVRIDENGNLGKQSERKLHSGFITEALFQDVIVHPNGSMFPKKVFDEIGQFNTALRVCTDYEFELRASLNYRYVALDKPTFMHRRHADNVSGYSFRNCKAQLDMLETFYRDVARNHISPRWAMKTLSRQSYRAGRCALREGSRMTARHLLVHSFRRRPSLKTLLWLAATYVRRGNVNLSQRSASGSHNGTNLRP